MAKPILTDEQWKKIQPALPPESPASKRRKRGRPPKSHKQALEGIL
jgi:transposase